MQLEPSHYLDSEVLKHSNYPEVKYLAADLDRLDAFFLIVNSALANYKEGNEEKVFLDMSEMAEHIELCRQVLEVLGQAENPCFDLIVDLRALMEECYDLTYMYRRYGSTYIQYNTSFAIEFEGGEGNGD